MMEAVKPKQMLQGNATILVYGISGSGKCVSWDTWVPSVDGRLKRIDEIVQWGRYRTVSNLGKSAKLAMAPRTVNRFYSDGIRPCLRIRTHLGREIKITPEHPLLGLAYAPSQGLGIAVTPAWKKAEELKVGDKVATVGSFPFFGNADPPDWRVKLMAYLIAEGCLGTFGSPSICSNSEFVMQEVEDAVASMDCYLTRAKEYPGASRAHSYMIYPKTDKKHNHVRTWLRELGLWGCRANDKFIPAEVFTWKREKVALFLSRLWLGDGWVLKGGKGTGYSSASRLLIDQIVHLLLRFGVVSQVGARRPKAYPGKVYWVLTIPYKGGLPIFFSAIPLVSEQQEKARAGLERKLNRPEGKIRRIIWDRIEEIGTTLAQPVYDLGVGYPHNFIANDFVCHNTILAGSLAEIMPTLFISTEPGGPISLAQTRYEPDVIEVSNISQLNQLISWLEGEGKKEYGGVVIDTISEYQMVLAEEVLQQAIAEGVSSGKVSRKTGQPLHSPDALELRDWQPVLVRMWRHIRKLQALSKNMTIVCTAQLGETPDPRNPAEVISGPALRGAWRSMIGAYFGIVAYLAPTGTTSFANRLFFQPTGAFMAKTRFALPPYLDNPTLGQVLKLIPTASTVEK